jgi:uncharacterized protein YajQ (UPF0234 family)
MPSFDIVSKVDMHEIHNAVDQANREVGTRFDFKGADATFELNENAIIMTAPTDFQLKQMDDILRSKVTKRNVDIRTLDAKEPEIKLNEAKQKIEVKQGIETETAKKIIKLIKDKKLKVQAAIQGDQVRVTGKKRDDLQEVIAMLRQENLGIALQYENFRD